MGFIKNWLTFDNIEELESGYSIGHYRKVDDKALLYNGEVVVPNISGVSANLLTHDDYTSQKVFFVKKTGGGYSIVNDKGVVLFPSLNSAVKNKLIKKETFVLNEEKNVEIHHYIMKTEDGKVLMIPQLGYVSTEFEEIGEMDALGRRKVTETDLSRIVNKTFMGYNASWYINARGAKLTPKILSEFDTGEYKIFYMLETKKGKDLDYVEDLDFIYDKNLNRLSCGYPYIKYVKGKFFARNKNDGSFLIDERGHKISDILKSYQVLNNGTVVGMLHNKENHAVVYDNDYKEIYNLENPTVDAAAGVVSGQNLEDEGKRCYMFGLNKSRIFLVNATCAELIIKILKGSEPPRYYTAGVLKDITEEELEQTICCYECVIRDNLRLDPENEELKKLSTNARETFLRELTEAVRESVEKADKGIKDVDKRKAKLLKQSEDFKQKGKTVQSLMNDIEKQ